MREMLVFDKSEGKLLIGLTFIAIRVTLRVTRIAMIIMGLVGCLNHFIANKI